MNVREKDRKKEREKERERKGDNRSKRDDLFTFTRYNVIVVCTHI